ncbi:hypothetical protein GCM10010916_39560 [Paenibacillus abyssi]|uniref:Uncharacterized protein n=1 Tax=Paenibacillus abyssi TaxID=1340531 RepID=A0A917LFU6_9BACL|nr:hypothetical protein GCM10010916_39560 [Paenibacillus abyssi]
MIMVFPFMVFFMFQPFLTEIVHMRGVVLEQTTHKYAKLAAREGYLSPTLINQMKADLQALNFNTTPLVVAGTTGGRVARGTDVNITVQYPVGNMFILMNWFGSDSPSGNYKFSATEMSEYIP